MGNLLALSWLTCLNLLNIKAYKHILLLGSNVLNSHKFIILYIMMKSTISGGPCLYNSRVQSKENGTFFKLILKNLKYPQIKIQSYPFFFQLPLLLFVHTIRFSFLGKYKVSQILGICYTFSVFNSE